MLRLPAGLILLLHLLAPPARAAPEVVVLPAGPFAADGERSYALAIYLVERGAVAPPSGKLEAHAARGQLIEPPTVARDGGVHLRYRPPRVQALTTDALVIAGQRVALELEPAGGTQLAMEAPAELVLAPLGRTAARETVEVQIHARDASGRPTALPLRLGASVGALSPPVEAAPGEYRATYTAPGARFPQVAILAASSPVDGAYAVARIALHARVTVEGLAEPGGTMRIFVDGHPFGPQPVGPDGRFAIPVVVPPGGRASGVSIDRLGNERRREIDLALPAFPRLLLMALPQQLRADGYSRAEVIVAAIDGRGLPLRGTPPRLAADAGWLGAAQPRDTGLFVAPLTAPAGIGRGAIRVSAGPVHTTVALRPGPPRRVTVAPLAEPLAAGLDAPQPVAVAVGDAIGAPIAGATLTATLAGGRVVAVADRGNGNYLVEVVPPADPGKGRAALHVEVSGAPPGPPRRISLHPLPSAAGTGSAEAWVDDDLGRPVPGVEVVLNARGREVRAVTDRYGTARIDFPLAGERRLRVTASAAPLGAARATLDLLSLPGSLLTGPLEDAGPPPQSPSIDVELPLRPALPIDLRITAEPRALKPGGVARVRVQRIGSSGPTVPDRLLAEVSAGRIDPLPAIAGAAEFRFVAPPVPPAGGRCLVSVTDPATRVTVFTEVEVR